MKLIIRGEPREFMPLQLFQSLHRLPLEFGVALFQPKDFSGLGRLDQVGTVLQQVSQTMVAAIPLQPPAAGWFAFTLELQILFRRQLQAINPQVGLHRSEIDYAVIQFGAVCQAFIIELASSRLKAQITRPFDAVYADWLNKSIEISIPYDYPHNDETWHIELVWHAYGRSV